MADRGVKEYEGDPPIEVPRAIWEEMVGHCRAEVPIEACGILAGRCAPRVDSIYALRNELASATLYNADPKDLIRVVRLLRERGERMLAIYHSHPRSAPIPSRTDLDLNHYGRLPRVIVAPGGAEARVRIWRLERDTYEELSCQIVDGEIESARVDT